VIHPNGGWWQSTFYDNFFFMMAGVVSARIFLFAGSVFSLFLYIRIIEFLLRVPA
jgi:hypothetical protein